MYAWSRKTVFLEDLNKFHPNLKFTSDSSEENVGFLDLKAKLKQGKIEANLHVKSMTSMTSIPSLYFLTPGAH